MTRAICCFPSRTGQDQPPFEILTWKPPADFSTDDVGRVPVAMSMILDGRYVAVMMRCWLRTRLHMRGKLEGSAVAAAQRDACET
jgi:hypothetical protein